MARIISPWLKDKSEVLDIFMGSGTLAEWCAINGHNYTGIEYDKEVFKLAQKRLEKYGI